MKQKLILGAGATFLFAFSFSCGSTPSVGNGGTNNAKTSANGSKTAAPAANSAPAAQKPELSVTAEALYQESKTNKNAMDKYQGKVVEISGKFDETLGSEESLTVRFATSDTHVRVRCKLADGTAIAVSKYEKGQDIKMIGIGDRYGSIDGLGFKACQPAS